MNPLQHPLKLSSGIVGAEVERLVRQRIGQNKFRDAMMDYWGGACAVTGVAIPEVLRASHEVMNTRNNAGDRHYGLAWLRRSISISGSAGEAWNP